MYQLLQTSRGRRRVPPPVSVATRLDPRLRGGGEEEEDFRLAVTESSSRRGMASGWLRFSLLFLGVFTLYCAASADNGGVKKMKMQFATGPLLKFQIW